MEYGSRKMERSKDVMAAPQPELTPKPDIVRRRAPFIPTSTCILDCPC